MAGERAERYVGEWDRCVCYAERVWLRCSCPEIYSWASEMLADAEQLRPINFLDGKALATPMSS